MLTNLYHLNDVQLFILLLTAFIAISFLGVLFVSRYIPLTLRYRNNPVIGNVSALISIIYGVLVGLMALYLINNVNYTASAIQQEANAVADLYRDSKWLKEPARENIQLQLKAYLERVIKVEWPLMTKGLSLGMEGELIIENITHELIIYNSLTNAESLLVHDMLDGIKKLYDSRAQRVHMSFKVLNPEIWVVILIGTFLIIMINFIYGINFYLHLLTISAVSMMAASMIFLLLTLDRPFQGDFVVEPSAFDRVLNFINEHPLYTKISFP